MTQNPAMQGKKIYEFEFDITGVTDYGVSMDAILTGKQMIPLQGARFDLAVAVRSKIAKDILFVGGVAEAPKVDALDQQAVDPRV